MRQNLLLTFLLFICTLAMGQRSRHGALELTFQLRHELQGKYTIQYRTAPYLNSLKLSGTSIGTAIGYKLQSYRGWFLRPAAGYYSFSVSKIGNKTTPAIPLQLGNARFIDYRPDSTPLGYATRSYHYNNLGFALVVGKEFLVHQRLRLTAGIEAAYLFSYSAAYKVAGTTYRRANFRNFGYLITGQTGILKEYPKFYAAVHALLPLFKQWEKDEVLFENPTETVKTWWGGYGLSITIGKYLK